MPCGLIRDLKTRVPQSKQTMEFLSFDDSCASCSGKVSEVTHGDIQSRDPNSLSDNVK